MNAVNQRDSNHEPRADFSMSRTDADGDSNPAVSQTDTVSKQPIQEAHKYMEMKPISHQRIPPSQQNHTPGNSSSLHLTLSASASSRKESPASDAILKKEFNSSDRRFISCSGPATFPRTGVSLDSLDSVITTYL
ncbi:uncharacterized protein LOC121420552 [Lytechinus variegatus]|uniref:uncharacterized protein LOC121420552 n=1 Tax=Lytechinus variegatus TaxID=7654 RepID=UPI001BB29B6D|nr:uncharacterized protein LOC121420552 [Lytechinus variegatus]